MLPKLHRLRSDRDFNQVFKGGKAAENRLIRIKFLENQKGFPRFGFIVGTKLAKKSAARNLVRRRLRAAARFFLKSVKPGFDIVIWPKGAALEADYKTLFESFKELLQKNDILPV